MPWTVHFQTASMLWLSYLGGGTFFISSFPRHQRVSCVDEYSSLAPLVAGVLQGCLISPLWFSLFFDNMTVVLEFSKFHMYADDLQIYHSRPRDMLSECIREVNSDLLRIFEWLIF
jgi:hypothetical protein